MGSGASIVPIVRSPYPLDASDQLVWRLNENSGVTTLVNSGLITSSDVNLTKYTGTERNGQVGIFRNCTDLNGTTLWNSAVDLSALTSVNFATLSVSMWVSARAFPAVGLLFSKAYRKDTTWTTPFTAYNFQINSSGAFSLTVTHLGSFSVAVATNNADQNLFLNYWSMIGFSYDGTTAKLYKDGREIRSAAGPGSIDYGTGGAFLLGGRFNGAGIGDPVTTMVDDIRVANVIRPASFWREAYKAGFGVQ